jgi:hypothetical protein
MIDSLYYPDEQDRRIFGDLYQPPKKFSHGDWYTVAHIDRASEDGYDVEIDESRLPARFFRLRALPWDSRPGFVLSTGSGDEIARLLLDMAREIASGMLAVDSRL